MNYNIRLRNGSTVAHTGAINTTTVYGWVLLIGSNAKIVGELLIRDVAKIQRTS